MPKHGFSLTRKRTESLVKLREILYSGVFYAVCKERFGSVSHAYTTAMKRVVNNNVFRLELNG